MSSNACSVFCSVMDHFMVGVPVSASAVLLCCFCADVIGVRLKDEDQD